MTNMSIQPLWLTHFIEILLVLEFQLTKFIVGAFSYKAHFRPQISSNVRVKLELPKFNGDEKQCITWINKAEEFFGIHNIHYDNENIKYASMQLEGNAYNWYMWWKTTTKVCSFSWNNFKNDLLKRFQAIT